MENCPTCYTDLRGAVIAGTDPPEYYSQIVGIELPGIYDGVLFYECPFCQARFHRFKAGTDMWRKADPYVKRLNPPPVILPPAAPVPKEEVLLSDDQLLVRVHPAMQCAGEFCSIHNPSQHPLRDRPRRFEDGIILRLCSHGLYHPDPDALAWVGRTLGEGYVPTYAEHPRCGTTCCCGVAIDAYR